MSTLEILSLEPQYYIKEYYIKNCFKESLLKSFNALHNYDFICLSESFLSPSVSSTLDSLNTDDYNIVRSDHPSGSKKGGVCCYFKESLPIRMLKITPMTECLVLIMLYNNKLVIVSVIYRLLVSLLKNLHNLKCFLVNF